MSAKAKTVYRCTECGADHPKWAGRCDVCGEWNTLVEEMATKTSAATASSRRAGGAEVDRQRAAAWRRRPGSATSGARQDRRLQAPASTNSISCWAAESCPARWSWSAANPASASRRCCCRSRRGSQELGHSTLYVSGEESALQVKLRADRLRGSAGDVALLGETLLETILATAAAADARMRSSSTRFRPSSRAISKARPATSGRCANAPRG